MSIIKMIKIAFIYKCPLLHLKKEFKIQDLLKTKRPLTSGMFLALH